MQNEDIKVLNEVHKGCEMGIVTLDDMMDKADDANIVASMNEAKQQFLAFRDKVKYELIRQGEIPKEVSGFQKLSASASISMSTMFDNSAQNLSEMIVKGNRMGEEKLSEELNENQGISNETRALCMEFIDLNKKQKEEFHKYLQG
jgi:hypothetical protein